MTVLSVFTVSILPVLMVREVVYLQGQEEGGFLL
jgi:hypothetical protein